MSMNTHTTSNLSKSIIATLTYADIFSYPLTEEEIYSFLIADKSYSQKEVQGATQKLSPLVQQQDGYYFLSGRKRLVAIRKKRTTISLQKYKKAFRISRLLSVVPWIQCIGVSGSLSMKNADRADDIDIFVITKKNSLWISRLFVTGLLTLFGERRTPGNSLAQDKICLNMWITTDALTIPVRNLFTAHEVIQLRPLVNKKYMYQKFLKTNAWVKKFLPHALLEKFHDMHRIPRTKNPHRFIQYGDQVAYVLQKLYMRKRRKTEVVSSQAAFFHPQDKTRAVLELYTLRLQYNLDLIQTLQKEAQTTSQEVN
jgi:hypothetical protein